MRIDGKQIAAEIFDDLHRKIALLKTTPHMAIILVGNDPASISYVNQKVKKAEMIGARATVHHFETTVSEDSLLSTIQKLNHDSNINGIIVQRPLPSHIDGEKINDAVEPRKDIDAFRKDSPYDMPLAAAVMEILKHVYSVILANEVRPESDPGQAGMTNYFTFLKWLESMNIVVMGKGETGGGPTIELLKKSRLNPTVIDSKTPNPEELTRQADVLICAVGKQGIVKKEMVKEGAILLAVGMQRGEDGKLHGDYEEEEIKDVVRYYTPIPGGVGPVNVAMLLKNLVLAAED